MHSLPEAEINRKVWFWPPNPGFRVSMADDNNPVDVYPHWRLHLNPDTDIIEVEAGNHVDWRRLMVAFLHDARAYDPRGVGIAHLALGRLHGVEPRGPYNTAMHMLAGMEFNRPMRTMLASVAATGEGDQVDRDPGGSAPSDTVTNDEEAPRSNTTDPEAATNSANTTPVSTEPGTTLPAKYKKLNRSTVHPEAAPGLRQYFLRDLRTLYVCASVSVNQVHGLITGLNDGVQGCLPHHRSVPIVPHGLNRQAASCAAVFERDPRPLDRDGLERMGVDGANRDHPGFDPREHVFYFRRLIAKLMRIEVRASGNNGSERDKNEEASTAFDQTIAAKAHASAMSRVKYLVALWPNDQRHLLSGSGTETLFRDFVVDRHPRLRDGFLSVVRGMETRWLQSMNVVNRGNNTLVASHSSDNTAAGYEARRRRVGNSSLLRHREEEEELAQQKREQEKKQNRALIDRIDISGVKNVAGAWVFGAEALALMGGSLESGPDMPEDDGEGEFPRLSAQVMSKLGIDLTRHRPGLIVSEFDG